LQVLLCLLLLVLLCLLLLVLLCLLLLVLLCLLLLCLLLLVAWNMCCHTLDTEWLPGAIEDMWSQYLYMCLEKYW
jgi:hypothetical protein